MGFVLVPLTLKTRRVEKPYTLNISRAQKYCSCSGVEFYDGVHFWLNGYVNKQNCCIWSETNPQVNVETPLHPEKLTVWCALWAGGILLQKR
ncbi:putative transposable element [Trichonephila clavipes]|uniref:Putative transposable element n=1 Tax=Trichonephila clavipes TaxID=2585209 RepID=A0A8X6V810_TRICX|nr:putative transposable element [Trichonephila clavipes]